MRIGLLFLLMIASCVGFSQSNKTPANNFEKEFSNAYNQYPDVPKGLLEAVSYTVTRFNHIQNTEESCAGLPPVYGVMGLTLDGKGYFRNNLSYISQVSEITVDEILNSPQQNILAFAAAYHYELNLLSPFENKSQNYAHILSKLSELPNNGLQQNFALNAHLYAVLFFMNDTKMQQVYGFPNHSLDLLSVFGVDNLNVLKSTKIVINDVHIEGDNGQLYKQSTLNNKSVDYPPALSNITPCNFSSRGTAIAAVTVHTIQGTYAGAISWANNCSSNVSYHYVLRSSDGQVTQVVLESDKAWHVGSENPYTIGMEHEGYVSDSTWYTAEMYQSSADLVRDITQSGYGISPLRTAYFPWASTTEFRYAGIPGACVTIKAHHHYPNQIHTDPGAFWDWKYYDNLINNSTPISTITNSSGVITDNGGSTGNYTGERDLVLIQPANATSITLNTVQFDVENTWDYLYIYDGNTVFSPLIGVYTGTTIPATITSSGGSLLLELRSDCATDAVGYEFNFTSTVSDIIKPTTLISTSPIPSANTDFTSNFTDADNVGGSGVMHQFYQVADYDNVEWRANNANGFFNDDFDVAIHPDWTDSSGTWSITSGSLTQSDETNSNSNLFTASDQNNSNKFLYHYKAIISGSGTNKRAGFHYMSDDAAQTNRGNSYFVWFRQDNAALQFYKVTNNVFSLEKNVAYTFNAAQEYDYKIVYDKITGITEVYVDDVFVDSWQDVTPITTGNYISLRSGDCIYDIDELRVYHSRTTTENILVGVASTNDIRYDNLVTPSGRINSLVIDSAYNISTIATEMVDVDFTITSIDELGESSLLIYPNPAKESVTIKFNEPKSGQLLVKDVLGKEVMVKMLNQTEQFSIAVQEFSQGVYFIVFEDKVMKFVVR